MVDTKSFVSKHELVGIPYIEVAGIVLGIAMKHVVSYELNQIQGVNEGKIYQITVDATKGNDGIIYLWYADVLSLIIGMILAVYGTKMHKIIRWIGVGIVLTVIAQKLSELLERSGITRFAGTGLIG